MPSEWAHDVEKYTSPLILSSPYTSLSPLPPLLSPLILFLNFYTVIPGVESSSGTCREVQVSHSFPLCPPLIILFSFCIIMLSCSFILMTTLHSPCSSSIPLLFLCAPSPLPLLFLSSSSPLSFFPLPLY